MFGLNIWPQQTMSNTWCIQGPAPWQKCCGRPGLPGRLTRTPFVDMLNASEIDKGVRVTRKLFSVCLAAVFALAQDPRGKVVGRVADATGAVVPNAEVRITNENTGVAVAGVCDIEVEVMPRGDPPSSPQTER